MMQSILQGARRGAPWACSLLLVHAVIACDEPTPPVAEAPAPEPPPAQEPAPEPPWEPPAGLDHTIGEGETLWQIARTYDVSVQAILDANRMQRRDLRRLRAGETLRIPGVTEVPVVAVAATEAEAAPAPLPPLTDGAYHHLAQGETLWDVARLYDVSLAELVARNELDDDAVRALRPGRAVVVPGVSARQVERATRGRAEATARAPRGFRHTVGGGETIWDLAGAFGVTVSEIMAANALDEAGVRGLREGARIWIPGVEQDVGGRVRRTLSGRQRTAATLAARIGLGTVEAARALLRGRVEARWIAAASRGQRRNRLPGTLLWPVTSGWFVRGYGSGEGGYHLATDVMGRIGWNVRAAAEGIVGYAGDGVPGYGNMVMLVHPGGWVTMYAHNSANSVVAGERVPRGGILGEVGSTGISRGPHVHFELMHDGRNCDPAPLWRPGIRHRSGRLGATTQATWTRPGDRPEDVRCDPRRRHPNSRWVTHESFGEREGAE